MLWHLRWTTLGILLWLLWLTLSAESVWAALPSDAPTQDPPGAVVGIESDSDQFSVMSPLVIAGTVILVGAGALVWLQGDLNQRFQHGQQLLALAQSNPSLIERLELHDGDGIFLRLTLSNLRTAVVIGLTPLECVRTFDRLQSISNDAAQCVIIRRPPETLLEKLI